MSMAAQPNAFIQADGQILLPHAQYRWDQRIGGEWRGYNVQAAWVEGDPVQYSGVSGYCRYHAPSDAVIVAGFGFIRTVIPLSDRSEAEQEHVREQVTDD